MFPDEIIDEIKKRLIQRKETIAAAESVTAGFLQAALASGIDAAKFFQGGITAYNVGQKARQLDIDPIKAIECNCVSAEMANAMAESVNRIFVCDWAIAITGYATPVPESGNKVFACFAIYFRGKKKMSKKIVSLKQNAADVQLDYVQTMLKSFLGILKRRS